MRRKGNLLFVPSGGLANRMRAIASAYTLTQKVDSSLQIVWFQDWALSAPFHSIFQPTELLNVREARGMDFLLYDRARKRNLWLPLLPQCLLYKHRIRERMVTPLKTQGFDFEAWAKGHQCYMSCYQVFGEFTNELYQQLFIPVKEVTDIVNRFRDLFTSHTIGLHIRRTDNSDSIEKSPTSLFIQKIKAEIEQHQDLSIFLATDDNRVKTELHQHFGHRIITATEEARRDSIPGIRGGLADMWALACTQKIYGSAGSSFSPMAAGIGGVPLEIVTISPT